MTISASMWRTLAAALALSAGPAFAANVSYMKDTPFTHFTKDDHKISRAALDDTLAKAADGEARTWSNPATGAGGELKPLKTFDRQGMTCRRVAMATKAKGRSSTAEYNFCKQPSGKWTLAN